MQEKNAGKRKTAYVGFTKVVFIIAIDYVEGVFFFIGPRGDPVEVNDV